MSVEIVCYTRRYGLWYRRMKTIYRAVVGERTLRETLSGTNTVSEGKRKRDDEGEGHPTQCSLVIKVMQVQEPDMRNPLDITERAMRSFDITGR